jgi:hypothetical protein
LPFWAESCRFGKPHRKQVAVLVLVPVHGCCADMNFAFLSDWNPLRSEQMEKEKENEKE